MFLGERSIRGSSSAYPFIIVGTFATIFTYLGQLYAYDSIPFLVIRTILGWPTLTEAFFLPLAIWSFRHIERLLGQSAFWIFIAYNVISYLPVYLPLAIFAKWSQHLALFHFYPYSLFLFTLAHVPATPVFLILSDKIIILMLFLLFIAIQFPYSLVPFVSAAVGNALWSWDCFGLCKCAKETRTGDAEGMPVVVRNRSRRTAVPGPRNGRDVAAICQMGFSRQEAVDALRRSRNDVQRAVEYLLAH